MKNIFTISHDMIMKVKKIQSSTVSGPCQKMMTCSLVLKNDKEKIMLWLFSKPRTLHYYYFYYFFHHFSVLLKLEKFEDVALNPLSHECRFF